MKLSPLLLASAIIVFGPGVEQPVHAELGTEPAAAISTATPMLTRDLLTVEQKPLAELQAPQSDLKITAWVDRTDSTYRPGDALTLSLQTSQDAHVTVLDMGTSGKTHIIFPNQHQTDNLIRAGQTVMVPAAGAPFRLVVNGPPGPELLKIIATPTAVPLFAAGAMVDSGGPFKGLRNSGTPLAKDLDVVLRQSPTPWASLDKVIQVLPTMTTAAAPTPSSPSPAPSAPSAPVATSPVAALPAPPVATGGTSAPAPLQIATNPVGSSFDLRVTVDKPVYRIGETVMVNVQSDRDCRLTLLDVGTSGKVAVLFPNRFQPDGQIKAGQPVAIPGPTATVDFKLTGPEGVEALIGVCTTGDRPALPTPGNYQQYAFAPVGDSRTLAKDLAVVLREPAAPLAHGAATFLVAP